MPLRKIKIGEPANTFDLDEPVAVIVNPRSCGFKWVMIGNPERPVTASDARTKPDFPVLYQWEKILVGDGIQIADDQEFLAVFHELRDIWPKLGKRRICNNNVRLFQYLNAFIASKIPVSFQFRHAYVFDIRNAVPVAEPVILKHDGAFIVVSREQVGTLVLVASRYQFFETKALKVVREVVKKFADAGIVAVAIDHLAFEVRPVVREFLLYVCQLGIEFVVLASSGVVQVHHATNSL